MPRTLFLPQSLAHWIEARPWLHVRPSDRARLAQGKQEIALDLHRAAGRDQAGALAKTLKAFTGRSGTAIPVIAGSSLSKPLRAALEAKDIGYLDSAGRLHLPWPNGLVHLEASTTVAPLRSSTIGVHSVRAVQAILEHPVDIQVTELAHRVGLSLSATHTVLTTLEREGLVRTSGSGPATRRMVPDRGALLDWLVDQPTARRRERYLDATFYARTPLDGWHRLRQALDRADIAHGLTGSAAAAVLGAGPTSVPMSTVRIRPTAPFATALAALQAEPTDRGANLRLVRDVGMVGTRDTLERDGVRLAPLARIYLDTLAEKRGEAVAEQLREVVLGY